MLASAISALRFAVATVASAAVLSKTANVLVTAFALKLGANSASKLHCACCILPALDNSANSAGMLAAVSFILKLVAVKSNSAVCSLL